MVVFTKYYSKEESAESPLLSEEKALQNAWRNAKPYFARRQTQKSHLVQIIDAFRRIKEVSRKTPRTVFEEYSLYLEKDPDWQILNQDINLLFYTAEIYKNFDKPNEAENLYEECLNLILSEGHDCVFNLKEYIQLMTILKQSKKCYKTIEKLTAKYEGYRYFLALAAIELKDYENAENLLDQCPRSSKITLCKIKVLYELKEYDEALDLISEVTRVTYPRDRSNFKKQIILVKGLFWLGKLRLEVDKNYLDAWPALTNLTWEILNVFDEDDPYPCKLIMLPLVPKILKMLEECLKHNYRAIKAKHSIDKEKEYFELAFNHVNWASQAVEQHLNLKALIMVNCSKLMLVASQVELPKKCYNMVLYQSAFDAHARLGNLENAIEEVHESYTNENQVLQQYGFNVDNCKNLLKDKLLLLYTRLKYTDEASEVFEEVLKHRKGKQISHLAFTHAMNLYDEQRHQESIELFAKHKNYKPCHSFLWRPAISYIHLGDYEKAMDALMHFMKGKTAGNVSFDEMIKAYLVKGYLYRKMKHFKEAAECFNGAKEVGDMPFTPFHKMLNSYERGNFKDYTKFMRQLIQKCETLKGLVFFLQCLIGQEERYLADEWRKILDIFILRSRDLWPKPEKDFPRFRFYRASSLLSLHFVKKRVQCLNTKN